MSECLKSIAQMRYSPDGKASIVVHHGPERLDEDMWPAEMVLRADAKFLPPLTPEDLVRHAEIVKRDELRRKGKR